MLASHPQFSPFIGSGVVTGAVTGVVVVTGFGRITFTSFFTNKRTLERKPFYILLIYIQNITVFLIEIIDRPTDDPTIPCMIERNIRLCLLGFGQNTILGILLYIDISVRRV